MGFAIKKEVFEKIKFNEKLAGYGYEDSVFAFELQKNNSEGFAEFRFFSKFVSDILKNHGAPKRRLRLLSFTYAVMIFTVSLSVSLHS